jgi:hypothetical protein
MTDQQGSILAEEVRQWNTPILSAYKIWEFTNGYIESHSEREAPVALLHFIAIALLSSPQLCKLISNRRKNLQSFVLGVEDHKLTDILISLQDRISQRKQHTLSAIDIAVHSGLVSWEPETGRLYAHKLKKKPIRGKNLRSSVKGEGLKARILGSWFAEHEPHIIANYLRVNL